MADQRTLLDLRIPSPEARELAAAVDGLKAAYERAIYVAARIIEPEAGPFENPGAWDTATEKAALVLEALGFAKTDPIRTLSGK